MSAERYAQFNPDHGKQRGAALIIMLVILIIGIAAFLVNSLSSSKVKNTRQENTVSALAQARDALIGFAITYGDTHSGQMYGYLPCPDTDGNNGLQQEGSEETGGSSTCAPTNPANIDVSVIGRLPWRTLGLPALRDGDGECLWYAVSGTYKDNPKTGMMNWDTDGQFQGYSTDGTQLTNPNEVVAVVIAPGATQPGQDRSGTTAPVCGGNYTVTNYLDNVALHGINNTDIATGTFIQGTSGGSVNDQLAFITREDIWNAILKRNDFQPTYANNPLRQMTRQVALCLANYGKQNHSGGGGWGGSWWYTTSNKSLPWPAPVILGTNQPGDYAIDANYNDSATTLYAGRVPYVVNTSQSISNNSYSTLMNAANCPSGWTASIDLWWNNWKDQLFYALSYSFKPSTNTGQTCGTCVTINGSGTYAAVVMLAGPRLSNQTRADKSDVTQYLEGNNASNYPDTTNGHKNYITTSVSPFNDVLCYIDDDSSLSVNCP
jgi:type II secretory pathway pseudopilin PulG